MHLMQHRLLKRSLVAAAVLACAVVLTHAVEGRQAPSRAFLQKELPLTIVLTTPVDLAKDGEGSVPVSGRQALTAVFSRPVIALGSDFGTPDSQQKLPFRLSCGVPGKLRWVTTTIARFDPDVDWPTDLDCELQWVTGLTSYDGVPLRLGDVPAKRRLTTGSLFMFTNGVTSEKAQELTDGLWSSYADGVYEVPPDGKITLMFSHLVHLEMVKSALQVVEGAEGEGPSVAFDLTPCQSAPRWPMPVDTNQGGGSGSPSGLSLDVNATCAEISPKSQLKPGTPYRVRLPAGSRYHALAGPLHQEALVQVSGLRPFKMLFEQSLGQQVEWGPRYRRLDLWLQHGLSADTPPSALARQVSLCALDRTATSCSAVAFNLSLPSRGKARLTVPSLQPGSQYRITVTGNPSVKDGFGQGLQGSGLTFWAGIVSYDAAAPELNSGTAILETGVEAQRTWPVVTRSRSSNGYRTYNVGLPKAVQGWELDLKADRIKALVAKMVFQRNYYYTALGAVFGPPTVSLDPSTLKLDDGTPDWARLELPLRDDRKPSRARLVSYCCSTQGFSSYAKLVLNTSLSFNVIQAGLTLTAWVQDTAPAARGPVSGAVVTIFFQPNTGPTSVTNTQPDPVVLTTCTTNSDGLCTMTVPSDAADQTLYAFAEAGDSFAVLEEAGWARAPSLPSTFVGSLVADRRVVVPGDSLKVTGFVQQATTSGLQLPPASWAALQITPSWDGSASSVSTGPALGDGIVRPGRGLMKEGATAAATSAASAVATMVASSTLVEPAMGLSMSKVAGGGVFPGPHPSVAAPGAVIFVKLDGTTGTLHGEIPVPAGARLQPYTVQLALPAPGDAPSDLDGPEPSAADAQTWSSVPGGEFSFTVADPRPPTAELKLETTPWTTPTGVVVVNVTAVSYIGASVDNSEVTLTWRHAKASGVVSVVTDVSGFASASIDLGGLPEEKRTTLYDAVTVDAEWIGPTRERITKSASVTLADGPARLSLQLSLTTDVPGTAFAVAATLTSNTDGTALDGLPVIATLRPATNDSTAGALCATTASCSIVSGAGFDTGCQLALPCVGRFEVEACTGAPAQRVCTRQTLGRNATEWGAQPLNDHPSPTIFADKTSYKMRDSPVLRFQSPWPNTRLLLVWGNNFKVKSRLVDSLATGFVSVAIGPLGDECTGGCSVAAMVDVPRLAAAPLPEKLRVSRLFDPYAPHTYTMYATLDVLPDNALGVSVSVAAARPGAATTIEDVDGKEVVAIAPGEEAQVTVSVKSGLQDNSSVPEAGSVEVTVYGVDKAFLDLLPYDLPRPEQELVLRLAADIRTSGMDAYRLAPGAVKAVFDKLMARLTKLDPWLPVDTAVRSSWQYSAVDADDEEYLTRFYSALTYMPAVAYYTYERTAVNEALSGSVQLAAAPLPSAVVAVADSTASSAERPPMMGKAASGAAAGTESSGSTVSVRQESDFVVTPLFTHAKTDAEGRATVTFVAPPNLGTFVIRAFAAAGRSARYGSGEAKLAVRRRLSLTPSVPRFVRVGDRFEAGAVVTVGSAPANVTISLELKGLANMPLSLEGPATKMLSFVAGRGLQQEVRFSFAASAVGSAALTLTASDGQEGGAEDGLELEIPVEGQQGDVWVATSFALSSTPEGSGQWQEGMDLPPAVPGSGGLSLTAGVGNFPAIATVYDNLLEAEKDRTYPFAMPAMLWATLPAVLSYYGQSVSAEQSPAVSSAFADLPKLTNSYVGLMYSDPVRWGQWSPSRTDVSLNTWALFLAGQHGPTLTSGRTSSSFSPDWTNLANNWLPAWRQAVQRQLVADAYEALSRQYGPQHYNDWHSLAWARLVLGASWTPDEGTEEVVADLSLDALVKGANETSSRQIRVVTALVLQSLAAGNPAPSLLATVLKEVTSALRVQGRTAYVAETAGSAAAAPLSDQALCLLLLTRSGASHQLLPKLAAYVANPSAGRVYGIFVVQPSSMEQGLAVAALSEYDKSRGSSQPNVEVAADANGLTVLQADFRSGGDLKPVTSTVAWEDIPEPHSDSSSGLNFQVEGTGEVSVAASLRFVPATLLPYPVYRGLYVEAALQMLDPLTDSPVGQRLAAVPLRSVVSYTVQVTTPDDLGAVTLSVMMPGGLEPLDPNVAAGVDRTCDGGWVDSWAWGRFFGWWWWPMCPAQETRPSVVTFSYLALRAGTSSVTIRAVAATPGTFVVPPVRASVDSQPEVMGMTAAGKLAVCADCKAPKYAAAVPQPVPCPNDCSGRGTCNLRTGRCSCDAGFARADCSRPVA